MQRRWRLWVAGLSVLVMGTASAGTAESVGAVAGVDAAYTAGRVVDGQRVPSKPALYEGEPLRVQATSVGRRSLEPTIGVDSEGRAFYAASWHDDSPSMVLPITEVRRSEDGGQTWVNVSPQFPGTDIENPPVNADPYVFVDQTTDRVFNPEAAGGCLYMHISDDAGDSWITNPVVCGGANVDHQSFEAGPFPPAFQPLSAVYPNVLWFCSSHVVASQCSKSLDGGITWLASAQYAFPPFDPETGGLCGGLTGHVEIDSQGRAVLPTGMCGTPYIAVTEDLGTTWLRVQVSDISAVGTHIAAAFDDADNLYVVWWDAEQRLPWLAVSTDHGRTFGEPMMVAPPGVAEVNFPEITAADAGKIALTFPGTTVDDRQDGQRPWNDYMVVSTNALDADPLFVSTTANPLDDPVHRGNCGPGRCTGMWDFIDIVTSPLDGGFWATLSDTCESAACVAPDGRRDDESSGMGIAVRQIGGPRIRTVAPPG